MLAGGGDSDSDGFMQVGMGPEQARGEPLLFVGGRAVPVDVPTAHPAGSTAARSAGGSESDSDGHLQVGPSSAEGALTEGPASRTTGQQQPREEYHGGAAPARVLALVAAVAAVACLAVVGTFLGVTCVQEWQFRAREEFHESLRLRQEGTFKQEHLLTLQKPRADMLEEVTSVMRAHDIDPDAVVSKMDHERFGIRTGAWAFQCSTSDVEGSLRAKLEGAGSERLPKAVIDSIVNSAVFDHSAAVNQRDFEIDGANGEGHLYHFRLRTNQSNGTMSVALMASCSSFDMKRVIDGYETKEEPIYESIAVPRIKRKGVCKRRAVDGRECVFPFIYNFRSYTECTEDWSGALWCATSTYASGKVYNWGWCSSRVACSEDEYETVTERKFVGMATKKIPVFSRRALPPGVTQEQLMTALDFIAGREAARVLAV